MMHDYAMQRSCESRFAKEILYTDVECDADAYNENCFWLVSRNAFNIYAHT